MGSGRHCVALLGGFFFLVAVDYRNLGLWFYDYLDRMNSFTSSPRMTPDRFRLAAGLVAAVLLGLLVYLLGGLV